MIKNYLKTAWRNLLKNKFYSLINISGLTAGLAVGILILLWVQDESGFDSFHKNSSSIYRLENQVGTGSSIQIWQATAAPIGNMGRAEIPGIEDVVRLTYNDQFAYYKYKEKNLTEEASCFTDPSLFSVFDFNLVKGNKERPFTDDNSLVLSVSAAKRFFGDEEPLGKVITTDDNTNFTVTGIVNDAPKNSSIRQNMFFPLGQLNKRLYAKNTDGQNLSNDFHQFRYETYFLMKPGTVIKAMPDQLRTIHLRNKADDTDVAYLLLPLEKMHLFKADGTEAGMEKVRMFTIIALLILTIACINYVNLSTARSMLRAKEVSLRKIVGAAKWQLFLQFIAETALLFLFAAALAIGLTNLLMPVFNKISGKEMIFDLFNIHIWKIITLTIICTLAASSIYPALLLSSFEPLKALKGKIAARISDAVFRKTLVVTQFVFSVVLIVGTFIISKQLEYIRSKELGYDKEHVFAFTMPHLAEHYDALRTDLLKQRGIENVTRSNSYIVNLGAQTGDNSWDGKGPTQTFMLYNAAIDKNFIPFFKMQVVQGENFSGSVADSSHFILNETAIRESGIKDAIGKKFRLWNIQGTIIGVVKDFHFSSMRESIQPAIFTYNPAGSGMVYVKTTGKDAAKAIAASERNWKQYNAGLPFAYRFLDETFRELYKSDQRTGTLFNVFAGIAIFISCLGLFGLAAYTAQRRRREIGIRKVLGASVPGIVRLLALDFIRLVLIAIVIAIPVAWYAMNSWLRDFAYKISIGWSVFLVSGCIAILIAIITISFQAIRSALLNPVKSLRTE